MLIDIQCRSYAALESLLSTLADRYLVFCILSLLSFRCLLLSPLLYYRTQFIYCNCFKKNGCRLVLAVSTVFFLAACMLRLMHGASFSSCDFVVVCLAREPRARLVLAKNALQYIIGARTRRWQLLRQGGYFYSQNYMDWLPGTEPYCHEDREYQIVLQNSLLLLNNNRNRIRTLINTNNSKKGFKMMKALITCLCLAPLSLASFVGPAFSGRGASFIRIRTQIFSKEAADHLKELDGKWDDLKGKVKSGEVSSICLLPLVE